MFYLFEPEIYERTIGNKGSEDYEFLTTLELDSPGLAEDGLSWLEGDPDRCRWRKMPSGLHFGVRSIAGTAAVRQDSTDRHNEAIELLTRFVEKRPSPTVKRENDIRKEAITMRSDLMKEGPPHGRLTALY